MWSYSRSNFYCSCTALCVRTDYICTNKCAGRMNVKPQRLAPSFIPFGLSVAGEQIHKQQGSPAVLNRHSEASTCSPRIFNTPSNVAPDASSTHLWMRDSSRRLSAFRRLFLVTMTSSRQRTPSPHKPRRRKLGESSLPKSEAVIRTPAFPLASFLWPARSSVSQWELLPLILMVAGLYRWVAGLWGYSGMVLGPYPAKLSSRANFAPRQVIASRPCLETTKHNDIGWRSRRSCQYPSGIFTTWSGGDLTILLSLRTTAGFVERLGLP